MWVWLYFKISPFPHPSTSAFHAYAQGERKGATHLTAVILRLRRFTPTLRANGGCNFTKFALTPYYIIILKKSKKISLLLRQTDVDAQSPLGRVAQADFSPMVADDVARDA